jgi:hypothetical protein
MMTQPGSARDIRIASLLLRRRFDCVFVAENRSNLPLSGLSKIISAIVIVFPPPHAVALNFARSAFFAAKSS